MNFHSDKELVVLIDGSALAFLHGNKSDYKTTIKDHIRGICKLAKTTLFSIITEDSKSNFRHSVAVTKGYKENRNANKEKIKEYLPYLSDVFTYINEYLKPTKYYGVENDDILSIMAYKYDNIVIAGNDIDLTAIPGKHVNIKTRTTFEIDLPGQIAFTNNKLYATGYFNTYVKILKGSQKENYGGVRGCGPKKTYELLKNATTEKEMFSIAKEAFIKEYGPESGEKMFTEGFQLCWLLTSSDSVEDPTVLSIDYLNAIYDDSFTENTY